MRALKKLNQRKPSAFKPYWDGLSELEQESLAGRLATTKEYLYQIANGFRPGGAKFVKKLAKETKYAVTKEQMRSDLYT